MQTLTTIAAIREALVSSRMAGRSIGLVPTMGALHAGHRSLVEASVAACEITVATLFVNPTQFGPTEDFSRYPRTFEADQALLAEAGCDFLFAPAVTELYPDEQSIWLQADAALADNILCGASRPGHFRGVLTIVAKLFNIIQPTHAFFGQKDFQQATLVQRLIEDLNFPITLVRCPTVREADGLAMSSRNRYLSPTDREAATVLSRALRAARKVIMEGETMPEAVQTVMARSLAEEPEFTLEYAELRQAATLAEAAAPLAGEIVLAIAGKIGTTRLIDNEVVGVPQVRATANVAEGIAHVS
ncbi:MAG: Pantothenate synthetase [bacterium]|nr:Pantothenate synthetase [bacterium]